jgi:anti-anti-sigma factor
MATSRRERLSDGQLSGGPELRIIHGSVRTGVERLTLVGELGTRSTSNLERVIREIFDRKIFRIVVDMGRTTYVSGQAISLLMESSAAARAHRGEIALANVPARIRHVLDLLGVMDRLCLAGSFEEALKRL